MATESDRGILKRSFWDKKCHKKCHKKWHKFLFYCASSVFFRDNQDIKNSHNQRFFAVVMGFFNGGGGESWTPVRKNIPKTFYECSLSFEFGGRGTINKSSVAINGIKPQRSPDTLRCRSPLNRRPVLRRGTQREDGCRVRQLLILFY